MSDTTGLEIAITGMAGRFPKAPTVEAFWSRLERGEECISRLLDDGLVVSRPSETANPHRVKTFGHLDGIERFDARLFGLNPRECELIDPQHRLLLECAWEAIERAAYDPDQLPNTPIGVFVGCGNNSYFVRNVLPNASAVEPMGGFTTGFGHAKDHLAPLLAFKLGLEGPSVTVQSACSTSLLAVHLACQSLLAGECDIALAGGVSIDVSQNEGYISEGGGLLSRRGQCRAFDAGADGMVPGNGVGIVVLKRLEEALGDSDTILAVIKGSAVGNDGSRRAGYGAPRADGQARVIRAAQLMAAVEASSLQYVEAHGGSTLLGDSVEIAALVKAFRATTDRRKFCALGSVKNNVGHLGAASGIAGLIKTVLAIGHRTIPPTLHFETPNPQIDFDSSPFFVGVEPMDWKRNGSPRRAGVSSFGMGGTNVHVIVEEAPERRPSKPGRGAELLIWSAATPSALEALSENLRRRLLAAGDDELADIAYTLKVGRRRLAHRRMLVCRNRAEALEAMSRGDRELEKAGHLCLTVGPGQEPELSSLPPECGSPGDETATVLERLGRLWLAGVEISWVDFYAGQDRRKVALPTYPFERERHWLERPPEAPEGRVEKGMASASRPALRRPLDEASYVEPANEVEREVAEIFQEILGIDRVGAQDSFFKLGGSSILGLQVVSRVRQTWDVELPLAELFESPTVAALARGITTSMERCEKRGKPGFLENLDILSDDDVDAMLAELMAEGR